jgi:quinohemoprotein ethanol dehydrogenase
MIGRRWVLFSLPIATLAAALTMPGLRAQQSRPENSLYGTSREWPMAGGDLGNQRYSTLTQINLQTVSRVGGAWMSEKFADGAQSRTTPVIKDGMIFTTAGAQVYAIDAKTGKTVWNFNAVKGGGPRDATTTRGLIEAWMEGYGLPNSQGVAVGEDKVFVGLVDGHLLALDERTGKLLWNVLLGDDPPRPGQSISAAPAYYDGVVYVGVANGDYHLRGQMVAVDAKTGKELWHFYAVPGPGETGYETWPKENSVWKVGGSGVWQQANVDPDLGLVYFVGGNPVPQYAGESRAGDNLFTSSVVALEMKTGKLRWYYQAVRHDIWDADIPNPPVLYDAEVNGQKRKAIAILRPDGYMFMFDRATGKSLFPIEDRPVPQNKYQKTAATQPYPVGAEGILPECSYWKDKIPAGFVLSCSSWQPYSMPPPSPDPQNVLAPGVTVRFVPFAHSQQTGYFYAHGIASLGWRHRAADEYYFGAIGRVPGLQGKQFGVLAAVDSKTNKVAWKKEIPMSKNLRVASMATAGGLLFHQAGDGVLEGMDAKTGKVVWEFQTGFAGVGSAPISYELDGQQYIAVSAGPTLWAFKLDGTMKALPAPELPLDTSKDEFVGPIVEANQIDTMTLYTQNLWKGGSRYHIDEYSFNPYRTRVKVGTTVTWINNGLQSHTIAAQNGSWTTGPITPSDQVSLKFDKPGTYTYIDKEHPWMYGQLLVVAADAAPNGVFTAQQSGRGKALYSQSCASCHLEDLTGRDAAPALIAGTFSSHFGGAPIGDLVSRVRTTMPQSSPNSLTAQAYLDIVAYLLQANGAQGGAQELTADSPALKNLIRDMTAR